MQGILQCVVMDRNLCTCMHACTAHDALLLHMWWALSGHAWCWLLLNVEHLLVVVNCESIERNEYLTD